MTPWRKLLYKELSNLSFSGKVLDLGGATGSDYHALIGGTHEITTVNIDESHQHDLSFNLEGKFPIEGGKYDAVLAINVMEHIYNYEQFLKEIYRVLKLGGTAVVAVPFLVQVHPSPKDYFRFTDAALQKVLSGARFYDIKIKIIGTGVGLARAQIFYNALRFAPLQFLAEVTGKIFDHIVSLLKKKVFFPENIIHWGILL